MSNDAYLITVATKAIAEHVYPADVLGDAGRHGDMWRALVAGTPYGPLLLMEFKLSIKPPSGGA